MVHELPYDDPERLRARLRTRYPIAIDRAIGLGRLPNARLQRALAGRPWVGAARPGPHLGPLALVPRALLRACSTSSSATPSASRAPRAGSPRSSTSAASSTSRCPTAPPWWASEQGLTGEEVRRIMVGVGEETWRSAWPAMYAALGGNPWAAMPSLHFATSMVGGDSLAEAGRGEGAVGWAYALTLGFALVYLGEHYVTDLAAGAAPRRRRARGGAARRAARARRQSAACSAWSASRTGSFLRVSEEGSVKVEDLGRRSRRHRRTQSGRPSCRCSPPRRMVQTALVVLVLLVGIYFLFPKLVGLGDALSKLDEAEPDLDRRRDRLQRRLVRHLHRPLQGRRRRRRAAPHLERDLRDQHGGPRRDAALLGRRGGRDSAHLLGAAQGGHARATRSAGGWSPSSPSSTPSTRSR